MAAHSRILAWEIPWTEEPGRLQSCGCKELDTTERLHFSLLKPGAGVGSSTKLDSPPAGWPFSELQQRLPTHAPETWAWGERFPASVPGGHLSSGLQGSWKVVVSIYFVKLIPFLLWNSSTTSWHLPQTLAVCLSKDWTMCSCSCGFPAPLKGAQGRAGMMGMGEDESWGMGRKWGPAGQVCRELDIFRSWLDEPNLYISSFLEKHWYAA